MASLESKSQLLEKLFKKKPLTGKLQSVNVFVVLNMAIHDPLIFLNVTERVFVNYLSQWKTTGCVFSRTVLSNVVFMVSRLCELNSCDTRFQARRPASFR